MSEYTQLNQNLDTKLTKNFYIEFRNINSNIGNFLAANIISVDRPIMTFDTFDIFDKGKRNRYSAIVRFSPLAITLQDDLHGHVLNLLYQLAENQNNHVMEDFEIVIKNFDNNQIVSDVTVCQRCQFSSVGTTPLNYSDTTSRIVDCLIEFESISFNPQK